MSQKLFHEHLIKTISYFAFFSYTPTQREVWRFLPIKISFAAFKSAIVDCLKSKEHLKKQGEYLYKEDMGGIDIRSIEGSKLASNEKLRLLHNSSLLFRINPFIAFVGVTGSVAANNATEHDDIDVFIISYPHRLWICRLITIVLLSLRGIRRAPVDTDVKDKVCCNLWFDGSDLQVPERRQTLFTAREIVLMKPFMNRRYSNQKEVDMYTQFITENSWMYHHAPNVSPAYFKKKLQLQRILPKPNQWGVMGNVVDYAARLLQKWIMRPSSTEYITDTQLWFFPRDISLIVKRKGLM